MRVRGTCYAVFAYDFGFAVDLDVAESRITDERRRLRFKGRRRAPQTEGQRPTPLRVTQIGEPVELGEWRTAAAAELVVFEVGAASIGYAIEVDGSLEELAALSAALYDNERLLDDSRRRMQQLMAVLGDAVAQPELSELVEDYVVFEVRLEDGAEIGALCADHAATVARILRAEPGPLSDQEIADALAQRSSYAPDDLAVVDWFASLLVGEDMADERAVLELCVVELLELRLLDTQLDAGIETAYEMLTASRRWLATLRPRAVKLERISQLQADAAVLFEGVNNAFKLVGDQYLARLYRVVSSRFRLAEWDGTIERKLHTLDSIHEKLSTRAANRRLEILEWIIVLLIAFDIAVYLFGFY